MTLTTAQLDVLAAVEQYRVPPTTRRVADRLETPAARSRYWSWARTYALLHRLQRRGLVEHDTRHPTHWHVTPAGYAVLLRPIEP